MITPYQTYITPTGALRQTQVWAIGATVKVGFLSLTVVEREPTPGDHRPDAYILAGRNGQRYRFVPHHGLERL